MAVSNNQTMTKPLTMKKIMIQMTKIQRKTKTSTINLKKYIVHKNDEGHNNESLNKKERIKEEIIRTEKKITNKCLKKYL